MSNLRMVGRKPYLSRNVLILMPTVIFWSSGMHGMNVVDLESGEVVHTESLFKNGSRLRSSIFEKVVTGTVLNNDGTPLAGATVTIKGTGKTVKTDVNGKFRISVAEGDILEISHARYYSEEVTVDFRSDYQVTLINAEVFNTVDEVVITGYTGYKRNQSASAATTVNAAQINNVSSGSFNQILQGKVPGMQVSSGSGQPGATPTVTIRGFGSINGSQAPLYIIDDVPVESNQFQTLNPNDVESVTVLKDASAKALYGSRGSNGVVVIKTKSGKKGKMTINYTSQTGISQAGKQKFQMMNTAQRLLFEEQVGLETGQDIGPGWRFSPKNPSYTNLSAAQQIGRDNVLDSLRKINIDWRDMFLRTGQYYDENLTLSGGGEQINYFGSVNYHEQQGIVKNTGLRRISLRNNVGYKEGNFSARITTSIGFAHSAFTFNEGGTSVGSPLASMFYALPYEYPFGPDGEVIPVATGNQVFFDTREGSRGLDVLNNTSSQANEFKTVIGIDLNYKILPGLQAIARAGVDYRNTVTQNFINPDSYIGSRNNSATLGGKGSFGEGFARDFNVVSTVGLTYDKIFAEKHSIEVSAFGEYNRERYRSFNYTGFGLDDRLPETPAGITVNADFLPNIGGGRTSNSLLSWMAVGRYTYNRKYTLTGSYRYDGSTKVVRANRWHGFYSVGGNWNVKQENFLKDSKWVNNLSYRVSYGQTASQFAGDFLYLPTYSTSTNYGNAIGIRPSAPGNPNFNWEFVNEFNTGFDLGLFQGGRLRLTMDFYNRITNNMFIDQPLSATSGFTTSIPLSTGKMRNRGVELAIDGMIVQTDNFQWSLGGNAAYNKNEILKVTDNVDQFLDGDTRIIKVGLPYGTYHAARWAGVNPQTGEAQYYTKDGQITTTYDDQGLAVPLDKTFLPKYTGGFNTTINWKRFTFYTLFTFVGNVYRWNNQDFYNENSAFMTSNQDTRMLYDRWEKPGDHKALQRIDIPRNFTSKDIQNAAYLRWRNVRISYALGEKAIQSIKFLKNFTVFAEGTNLYTWTHFRGLDPENDLPLGRFAYPSPRTYTVGFSLDF